MLNIQDPTYRGSILLHEALLEACGEAVSGAGAYAFVSADGVNLLMKDSAFHEFIQRGPYRLIIGMDEITNLRTLAAITELCAAYPNLWVRAFLHDTKGSTFHPKFSWFKTAEGGCIVVGSGNLTSKGLRRNREAYVVEHVNETEILEIELKWNLWLESCEEYLKDIDDPAVLLRAEENKWKFVRKKRKRQGSPTPEAQPAASEEELTIEQDDEIGAWGFDATSDVLVAEIPVGRKRTLRKWCQANFKVETLRSFFETEPHAPRQLVLRKVTKEGFLKEIETRGVVSKKSSNYCFELTPPENTLYPQNGRPLGVFVKLSPRTFIYMVVMPAELGHAELEAELDLHRENVKQLVRYQTHVTDLIRINPNLAILRYLNNSEEGE